MPDETKPETTPGDATDEPQGASALADREGAGAETSPVVETADAGDDAEAGEEKKEKLHQQVYIMDVGPCRKRIKVTVERDDVDKLLNDKYKELVGDSWVPGFRKGKAPRQIVVRKFKKDVQEQVKSQILLASLEQLADENDVAPLSPPNINPDRLIIPDKGPFVYEFEVEVRPQFELPNYRGLKLRRPTRTFSERDVEREIRRVLSNFGQLVPKDGAAELDDVLVVDMTTRLGDQVIGSAREMTLRIDDTVTFKDGVASNFGTQTIGAKAGDTRKVDIRMTDAVADENLKGKTVQATLEIKDVKQNRQPELTEGFLQEQLGVRTQDQLRERVRLLLDRRLEYAQRQSAREQVLEQISAASSWELPHDLLMRQARRALGRRVMEMREAGLSDEEIESRRRLLERDVLKSTALALKEHFVLQKIAEVEKIELDDDEIDAEIESIADQVGESPRHVRAQYEREDLIETLAAQLIERKALNLVLENAEYEDVPMEEEAGMSTSQAQAVPGEMKDPTAAPPEPETADESEEKEEKPA
jgi:trigger factor